MKYKLGMLYPTRNRSYNMNEVLFRIADVTNEMGVGVYILDRSDNDNTERIVNRYIGDYDNIHYRKYEPNDEKSRGQDYLRVPECEYLWFIGDKVSPTKDAIISVLNSIEEKPTIICTYGEYLDIKLPRDYKTCSPFEFLEITASPFAHYCSLIVKKEVIRPFDEFDNISPDFGLQEDLIISTMLENYVGIIRTFKSWTEFAYEKAFYKKNHMYVPVWHNWIDAWFAFINNLPEEFNNSKSELFRTVARQTHMFSTGDLMCQRRHGEFNLTKCIRDRRIIKKTIGKDFVKALVISAIPKSISNVIYPLFHRSGWMKSDY